MIRTVLTFASINGLTSILNCFNSPNDWPSLSRLRLSLGATVRHQISAKRLSEGGWTDVSRVAVQNPNKK